VKKYLILILIVAIILRFNHLNWDANQHLHPDERFLTMVGNSLKIPKTFGEYLDVKKSTLNPANNGYKFFVYGTFPLVLTKYLAVNFGMDNYNEITILGRFLSALVDFLTVILVYKTTKLLLKKFKNVPRSTFHVIPLFSAFFYAVSVYPIQASHFFTTDSFQVFFSLMAVYLVLRKNLILSAFFFGLAMASKISAVFILPLILIFIFLNNRNIKKSIFFTICYLLLTTFFIFLADPRFFTKDFFDNLQQLRSLSVREAWYPPLVQWLSKTPVVFSLFNLIFVGVGLPYFILIIIGVINIFNFPALSAGRQFSVSIKNWKFKILNYPIFIILIWVIVFFLYQSSQLVQSLRYLYILYPFLAILAAIGAQKVISDALLVIKGKNKYLIINTLYFILILLLLIWPLMFSSIYFHKNTRVEASEWIYENLKNNSTILGEYWDDLLPLPVNTVNKNFQIEALPVFDPDTSQKWQKMRELLNKGDYYVLSSNRGWGSIPTVPDRYPLMSRFYQALLSENCQEQKKMIGVCYKKIKTFEPYYYKFIKYPNSWVEETFTVYDHPTVMIYKKV
jgi:hypothetical protein